VSPIRHRNAVIAPFVLLLFVTWIGGFVNATDVRARIIDDLTDKGVKDARITHGMQSATSDESGNVFLPNVPRTSKYQIDVSGYFRTSAPTTVDEIRLKANSVVIYAYDATKTPTGCPPLPTPSPAPGATPVPSRAVPTATASPSKSP